MMIPPQYAWPMMIVGLLVFGVGSSFTLLFFALSDDGPQVLPDYYARSANYDAEYQAKQDSIKLGWAVDIDLHSDNSVLTLHDRAGTPVSGALGSVTFYRPSQAEALATVELTESPLEPGRYHFTDLADAPGLWDLAIELHHQDQHYIDRIRKNIAP